MSDVTIQMSERILSQALNLLNQNFVIESSGEEQVNQCLLGYDLRAHLEGGSIHLRDDGSVRLSELDLRWDRLKLFIEFDLVEIELPGGCLDLVVSGQVFEFCWEGTPIFTGNPTVRAEVDLAEFGAQEFSLSATFAVREWDPSAASAVNGLCDALRELLVDNTVIKPFPTDRRQWHIHLVPDIPDVDFFDFADVAADEVEEELTDRITELIPEGPIRDVALVAIGGIAELIRTTLDAQDDIGEWLDETFNMSFGLDNILWDAVLSFFGHCIPIFRIDNPFPMLEPERGDQPRISVKVPIENLSFSSTGHELMITADFGA